MLKIGALSFINSMPFFFPFELPEFKKKFLSHPVDITYGTPTEINKLLENDQVDIGLISSASFIENRDRYILLTNLGIGATKRVDSVCLYTRLPINMLDGKTIGVPSSSATSTMLLKVLCHNFWGVKPKFKEFSNYKECIKSKDVEGFLLIGDECLREGNFPGLQITDLAEAWHKQTKMPFVFAVFATRVERWTETPEEVKEFHKLLSLAYEYSLSHMDDLIAYASKKCGLSTKEVRAYYKLLDYSLDASHFQGLDLFDKLRRKSPQKKLTIQ